MRPCLGDLTSGSASKHADVFIFMLLMLSALYANFLILTSLSSTAPGQGSTVFLCLALPVFLLNPGVETVRLCLVKFKFINHLVSRQMLLLLCAFVQLSQITIAALSNHSRQTNPFHQPIVGNKTDVVLGFHTLCIPHGQLFLQAALFSSV